MKHSEWEHRAAILDDKHGVCYVALHGPEFWSVKYLPLLKRNMSKDGEVYVEAQELFLKNRIKLNILYKCNHTMAAGATGTSTPVRPPTTIITALLPPAPLRRAFNQLHLGRTMANEAL